MNYIDSHTLLDLAESGNTAAQFHLALQYLQQDPEDFVNARRWFRRAYLGGQKDSAFMLGIFYKEGLGVSPDKNRAKEYFLHAVRDGHINGVTNITDNFVDEYDVDFSHELLSVCKLVDVDEILLADYKYPLIFDNTRERDLIEHAKILRKEGDSHSVKIGYKLLKAIADMGFPEASLQYGQLIENENCPKKAGFAFRYYELAGCQGNAEAQYRMGQCYLRGIGIEKCPDKAFTLIKKAADQQCQQAEIALALLHSQGIGIKADDARADELFKHAKSNGIDLEEPFSCQNNLL